MPLPVLNFRVKIRNKVLGCLELESYLSDLLILTSLDFLTRLIAQTQSSKGKTKKKKKQIKRNKNTHTSITGN